MSRWDVKFLKMLRKLGITVMMYKRYVDDIVIIVKMIRKGVKFDKKKKILTFDDVSDEEDESESRQEAEKRTFEILRQIADSIDKDIQFEEDICSNHDSEMIPVLDLQCGMMDDSTVHFQFYSKPMSSKFTILQRSALGSSTKRNTLFQESLRRLRNCHPDVGWSVKAKHLSDFSNMMRISGYGKG